MKSLSSAPSIETASTSGAGVFADRAGIPVLDCADGNVGRAQTQVNEIFE
jgi:hypothetical protein